jgi:LacI family transcriptional regulator
MPRSGDRLTIKDVARAAQVSVGTVSRVLNRNATVRPEVRSKVQRAIEQLGYTPNAVAQSMRSRFTQTVGCVIREIKIPALAAFVRAAHDVLDEAGFSLLITNSEGRVERERELLKRLAGRRTDGIMMGPYTPVDDEFDAFLRNLAIPILLIDRDEPAWADAVLADHASSVRAATEHLLDLGHRRIALLTGEASIYPARERVRGYREAHAARALCVDPSLIQASSFLPSSGYLHTSSMLAGRERPTAIIAGGIDMLSGVLRATRVRGLEIPRDLSIVGAGDSELAELYTPAISVEHWDQARIGQVAAELLLDRLVGGAGPEARRVLLPSEFVVRASTAPPPRTRRPATTREERP